MKRYCKNINLYDDDFLTWCVTDCLKRKWKRRDVISYFSHLCSRPHKDILREIREGGKDALIAAAVARVKRQLIARKLQFIPIWHKEKVDASNHKVRRIGIQHISQQLFDYVAVYGMHDLCRRIGEYQCACIPGRGPLYGVRRVKKWLREKDVKYVVQLDVKKCFPSVPQDRLLAYIDRYIANDDLKWLIHELVGTFDSGLSIGSYLSQYLCNLYLSQLYHEVSERMYYERRGKRIRCVKHVLFYADDILLLGTNLKAMYSAVKRIIAMAKDDLGLTIKPNWSVRRLSGGDFIDTMGFRVYSDHITLRRRVFLRVRRAYKKPLKRSAKLTVYRSQKCISYLGSITNADLYRFAKRYKVYRTARKAKGVVSNAGRIRCRAAPGAGGAKRKDNPCFHRASRRVENA